MSICPRCGDLVSIRYVNGNRVPIHESGRCGGPLPVNDYSGRRRIDEDLCYERKCPECGDNVFFIRHNGGCCWIDPPLGAPWYKHSCFNSGTSIAGGAIRESLCEIYLQKQGMPPENHHLCVVSSTEVSDAKQVSRIRASISKASFYDILVTGCGGYLIGKLCIYDRLRGEIYPIDEPKYLFNVIAAFGTDIEDIRKNDVVVTCPKCDEHIPFYDFARHMDLHYYDSVLERYRT